ncbi:MAG: hypothetical protein V7K67_26600 [Nostoc sp.]|uniref:hypothetical protein n=1 Tax=Nostoc sp. TaxID=1180 RepID=UPI002FF629A4
MVKCFGTTEISRVLLSIESPAFIASEAKFLYTGEPLQQEFFWETDMKKKCYDLIAVKLGDGFSITVSEVKD